MKRPNLRTARPFRRLQWRLTLSYTMITVAVLVAVELLLVAALLIFVQTAALGNSLVEATRDAYVPSVQRYLGQDPPDLVGLEGWLANLVTQNPSLQTSVDISFDEPQQIIILDPDGRLLAHAQPLPGRAQRGETVREAWYPGLAGLLNAARQPDPPIDTLQTRVSGDSMLMALPIAAADGRLLGFLVSDLELPRLSLALLGPIAQLLGVSLLLFTVMAGAVGSLFGFLTARGLSRRLADLAGAADAWSQGDFSAVVHDASGDELGQLSRRLNRMAEQLQNLLHARQELATLEERNRLARDLHDSIKQQVFATTMQLGAANALLESDPAAAQKHLVEAQGLANQAQQELTGLIQELRPAALDGQGLADALRDYATNWERQTGVTARVRVQGERPLSLALEQALFRVAQEALANVARHSGVDEAELHLAWRGEAVRLEISDNGRGFDRRASGAGLGLTSMRERVEGLGGRFNVESEPGRGTRVAAVVPLSREASPGAGGDDTDS